MDTLIKKPKKKTNKKQKNKTKSCSSLGEGKLIFCCPGPTNSNFQQIKIIVLISHKYLFFILIIFLLDSKKIHKKQKFNVLDIVESQSKEMWLVSYVTCVDIITGLFNSITNIFIFKSANLET